MIKFNEIQRFDSEILFCEYVVGAVGDKFIYVWSDQGIEDEITEEMIDSPEALHGALIGTKKEIIWELENCVGSFRDHGDEDQAEEASEIVEELSDAVLSV